MLFLKNLYELKVNVLLLLGIDFFPYLFSTNFLRQLKKKEITIKKEKFV